MFTLASISGDTYWAIAISIGFGAAVVVAILLTLLLHSVASIERSVDSLLDTARSPRTPPSSHSSRPRPPCCR